ncbi:ankyrin repeat-containing protein [Besnoitia besnoiti]|uniref:Ankyrin repeat-containing protein n=1 Tax=Besnoitia besnoiti TaxID=94643 RepID=A0A2A9ME25_BESBE|nr:ankyrin repeat-containing protein [Besnoitia besnoiti]PFH36129.1 ankyrin repeat-containing protein [Besnoitia besnoiti]
MRLERGEAFAPSRTPSKAPGATQSEDDALLGCGKRQGEDEDAGDSPKRKRRKIICGEVQDGHPPTPSKTRLYWNAVFEETPETYFVSSRRVRHLAEHFLLGRSWEKASRTGRSQNLLEVLVSSAVFQHTPAPAADVALARAPTLRDTPSPQPQHSLPSPLSPFSPWLLPSRSRMATLVEVMCGGRGNHLAFLSPALSPRFRCYVGIDISDRALAISRTAAPRASPARAEAPTQSSCTAATVTARATAGLERAGKCRFLLQDCGALGDELPLLKSAFALIVAGLDDVLVRSGGAEAGDADELHAALSSVAATLCVGGKLLAIEPTRHLGDLLLAITKALLSPSGASRFLRLEQLKLIGARRQVAVFKFHRAAAAGAAASLAALQQFYAKAIRPLTPWSSVGLEPSLLDVDALRTRLPLLSHLARIQATVELSFLLFQACLSGNLEAGALLLARGADPNVACALDRCPRVGRSCAMQACLQALFPSPCLSASSLSSARDAASSCASHARRGLQKLPRPPSLSFCCPASRGEPAASPDGLSASPAAAGEAPRAPAGRTRPLHVAAAREDVLFFLLLLQHGADPSLPDERGLRPADILADAARSELRKLKTRQRAAPGVSSAASCACLRHEAGVGGRRQEGASRYLFQGADRAGEYEASRVGEAREATPMLGLRVPKGLTHTTARAVRTPDPTGQRAELGRAGQPQKLGESLNASGDAAIEGARVEELGRGSAGGERRRETADASRRLRLPPDEILKPTGLRESAEARDLRTVALLSWVGAATEAAATEGANDACDAGTLEAARDAENHAGDAEGEDEREEKDETADFLELLATDLYGPLVWPFVNPIEVSIVSQWRFRLRPNMQCRLY